MDPLAETTDESPDASALDFEGRRAFAAVLSRLTGRGTGMLVGRYKVLQPLGEGGFATVYEAEDPKLQRKVAIKVLKATRSNQSSEAQERLVREAQALAQLGHPNVVKIFDVGITQSEHGHRSVYIVMELLAGPTLGEWLQDTPPSLDAIVRVYRQAALGLAAAHDVGVIHRDFKPSNAMFTADGRVKVLDFGLARLDGSASSDAPKSVESTSNSTSLTQTGCVMGTPRYMAPEQHRAGPNTEKCDQYALCIALWEAVAGEPPFMGTTARELAVEKRGGPPPRPKAIPRNLYRVLLRGLGRDPQSRFPTMRALVGALRLRSRSRWLAVGAAGVGLATVAVIAAIPEPAPAVCTTPVPQWSTHFDSVLQTMTPPRGDKRWGAQERIRLRLHRFERQWTATRTDVCEDEAAWTEQRQRAALCLARGAEYFSTLIERAQRSEGLPPPRLFRQFLATPVPNRCTTGDATTLYVTDSRREDRLDRITATAYTWTRHEDHGPAAELDRDLEEALELGDAWVTAQVYIARAVSRFNVADSAGAATEVENAVWHTETAGDPLRGAELLPSVIAHLLDSGAPSEEIRRLTERAEGLIAVAGDPRGPRIDLLAVSSAAAVQTGDVERSTALALEAVALSGEDPLPGSEHTVAFTLAYAMASQVGMIELERVEAGLQRALAVGKPTDYWYPAVAGIVHQALSETAIARGDMDVAIQQQIEAMRYTADTASNTSPQFLYTTAVLGRLLSFQGSDALGVAYMANGYATIIDTHGSFDAQLTLIAGHLAEANLERGDAEEALLWAQRQQEHARRQFADDHIQHAWPRVTMARALVALGRLDEAQTVLDATPTAARSDHSVLAVEGMLHLARGEFLLARDKLAQARADLDDNDPDPFSQGALGDNLAALAQAENGLGNQAAAERHLLAAMAAMARSSHWHRVRAETLRQQRR